MAGEAGRLFSDLASKCYFPTEPKHFFLLLLDLGEGLKGSSPFSLQPLPASVVGHLYCFPYSGGSHRGERNGQKRSVFFCVVSKEMEQAKDAADCEKKTNGKFSCQG